MLCLKTQQKTNLNHSLHCHDTKFKLPVCHTVPFIISSCRPINLILWILCYVIFYCKTNEKISSNY